MEHPDFMTIIEQGWTAPSHFTDPAKIITAKFKNLRRNLKIWKSTLSNLKSAIQNVKLTLSFFLYLEEFKDLSVPQWNFKIILEKKLLSLLKQQNIYWK